MGFPSTDQAAGCLVQGLAVHMHKATMDRDALAGQGYDTLDAGVVGAGVHEGHQIANGEGLAVVLIEVDELAVMQGWGHAVAVDFGDGHVISLELWRVTTMLGWSNEGG